METISVIGPANHTVGHILHANQIGSLLRCGERHMVVDLKRVTTIDAAGVGELVSAYNMARAAGATVRFVNPRAHVRELIERAGLADVLLADHVT